MKRRAFIGMAAVGAGGATLAALGGERSLPPEALIALPHLLRMLPYRLVHDLGVRYRETTPAENSEHALRSALRANLAATGTLPAQLQGLVRRDFADGRTVTLNGWILSLTEARQCALYSLLAH